MMNFKTPITVRTSEYVNGGCLRTVKSVSNELQLKEEMRLNYPYVGTV